MCLVWLLNWSTKQDYDVFFRRARQSAKTAMHYAVLYVVCGLSDSQADSASYATFTVA